jgi:serine/threonine-protein kinase
MLRSGNGYLLEPATNDWFELPASRGFAGYGLGRALRMLLDALGGLSALHGTKTLAGAAFAHGEFAPTQFRIDPLGVCRLIPLTPRHYISDQIAPALAALGYISPERLILQEVGVRADVFSAGVLLWEALAGTRLFDEQRADVITERLMTETLRAPPLPPELAWAAPLKVHVERALALNQCRRFADCAELAAAIQRVAADHLATHAEIADFFLSQVEASQPSGRRVVPVARQKPLSNQIATFGRRASAPAELGRRQSGLDRTVSIAPGLSRLTAPPVDPRSATSEEPSDGFSSLFAIRELLEDRGVHSRQERPASAPPPLPQPASVAVQSLEWEVPARRTTEPASSPPAELAGARGKGRWQPPRRWVLAAGVVAALAAVVLVLARSIHKAGALVGVEPARGAPAPSAQAAPAAYMPSCPVTVGGIAGHGEASLREASTPGTSGQLRTIPQIDAEPPRWLRTPAPRTPPLSPAGVPRPALQSGKDYGI